MIVFFLLFLSLSAILSGTEHVSPLIQLGYSHLELKKFKEAEQIFLALQADENLSFKNFGNLGLAKIAIAEDRFSDAKNLLKKMKESSERLIPAELNYEWIYAQADLAIKQGSVESGIVWLQTALADKPKSQLLLSQAYLKKGDLKNARFYFDQIESTTDLERANFVRVAANISNDYEWLNPAQNSLTDKKALCLLGEAAFNGRHFIYAADYFEKGDEPLRRLDALIQAASFDQAKLLLETLSESSDKTYLQASLLSKEGKKDEAIVLLKREPSSEKRFFSIGLLYYEEKKFLEAFKEFRSLQANYPDSKLIPEALYWSAKSQEALDGKYCSLYKDLYERFPEHPLAAEAYYSYYTLQDYLLGNRAAIKHLHEFKTKFPKSPLLLHAAYLEGLDSLRDRRSPEGKWLSRQNLTLAIDAFQRVESLFDELNITQNLSELIQLRYQAILERAKTNLKIADHAKAAKKAVYLDYAEEEFKRLIADFDDVNHPLTSKISPDSLHPIVEESLYYLALTQVGTKEKALGTLRRLISFYEENGIDKGYYLASALYQKGILENNSDTLNLLNKALFAAAPSYFSIDEVLNVMIAKAEYERGNGNLDAAMLQLSEVVNSETASSLRLKAMFLRAEIYAEQGRIPLAQKQLESIALKGGDWALKAKEQLETHYGYD